MGRTAEVFPPAQVAEAKALRWRSKLATASPTRYPVERTSEGSAGTARSRCREALLAQSDLGRAYEIAGEHQRPAHECSRDPGRLRHRVDHEAGERALPQLARQQPLSRSPPPRQWRGRADRRGFPRAAELAPVASETAVVAVEVADGQGRLSAPRMVDGVDGGVGGADPALSRDARETPAVIGISSASGLRAEAPFAAAPTYLRRVAARPPASRDRSPEGRSGGSRPCRGRRRGSRCCA
jgi:hypothetical protein